MTQRFEVSKAKVVRSALEAVEIEITDPVGNTQIINIPLWAMNDVLGCLLATPKSMSAQAKPNAPEPYRILTTRNVSSLHLEGLKCLVWEIENGHKIPLAFPAEAIPKIKEALLDLEKPLRKSAAH